MFEVILTFHDAKTLKLLRPGDKVDWTEQDRIKSALERGLIREIVPEKAVEEVPKPKAPAKKKKK